MQKSSMFLIFLFFFNSLPANDASKNSKSNGGSVEALQEHPTDPDKVNILNIFIFAILD